MTGIIYSGPTVSANIVGHWRNQPVRAVILWEEDKIVLINPKTKQRETYPLSEYEEADGMDFPQFCMSKVHDG